MQLLHRRSGRSKTAEEAAQVNTVLGRMAARLCATGFERETARNLHPRIGRFSHGDMQVAAGCDQ